MPKFSIKDGVLTAESYVRASAQFTCKKGTSSTVTFDFPEGMVVNGRLVLNGAKCPCCGEDVAIPRDKHEVDENGNLVSQFESSAPPAA